MPRRERTTIRTMAMGKRTRDRQPTMWVLATDLPTAASHPFYRRLNQLLREHGFDDYQSRPRLKTRNAKNIRTNRKATARCNVGLSIGRVTTSRVTAGQPGPLGARHH